MAGVSSLVSSQKQAGRRAGPMDGTTMSRNNRRGEFIVIGLDGFGENVALELLQRGRRVLGIDRDPLIVQQLADNIQDIVAVDATDHEALESLGVEAFDTAIVAIGGNLAQAVLVTLTLKDLGIRWVVCEAQTEHDERVLRRVGADEIVTPDIELARAIADGLTGQVSRATELHFGHHLAVQWPVPLDFGGTLGDLMARYAPELTVLMLLGRNLIYNPAPDTPVGPGDQLLIAGPAAAVRALQEGRQP